MGVVHGEEMVLNIGPQHPATHGVLRLQVRTDGEVVSQIRGSPYTEYLYKNVTRPLGLTSTVFDLSDKLRPHSFVGYNPTLCPDRPERAPSSHLNGLASAGQLYSTVYDLAKRVSF